MTVSEVSGPSLGLGSLMIPALLAVADTSAVGGGDRTFEIFLEFSTATHMDIVTLFFFFLTRKKKKMNLILFVGFGSLEGPTCDFLRATWRLW